METKEQLVVKIKEWINLDTELVHLKQQIKTLNTKKKNINRKFGVGNENKPDRLF